MLILYPTTLLNTFISFNRFFFVESLGFSVYKNTSFANRWFYFFLFKLDDVYFFFFCLIAVARTSGAVLNKSCESEHPCLVPHLRGKSSSFSLLSVILDVGISYMACIILRYFPTILHLLSLFLNRERMLNFVKCLFCINWDDCVIFFFSILLMYSLILFLKNILLEYSLFTILC